MLKQLLYLICFVLSTAVRTAHSLSVKMNERDHRSNVFSRGEKENAAIGVSVVITGIEKGLYVANIDSRRFKVTCADAAATIKQKRQN
jgi:hypothetical protein